MSAEERLNALQVALEERGVKDVKFLFGSVSEKGLSQLASDVADALDAVLGNRFAKLPPLGDSVRTR